METTRTYRLSACAAIALTLVAAAVPAFVSASAPPPPPPPPGWGPVVNVVSPWSDSPNGAATTPDGRLDVVSSLEINTANATSNASIWVRGAYSWIHVPLAIGTTSLQSPYLVSTGSTDRAVVVTYAAGFGAPAQTYAAFLTSGGVVGSPFQVSDTPAGSNPFIGATAGGNVMASWTYYNNGTTELWSNHSLDGAAFDGATRIDLMNGSVAGGSLLAAGSDDFAFVWWVYNSPVFQLRGSFYRAGAGWSTPANIGAPVTSYQGMVGAGSSVAGRASFLSWVANGSAYDLMLYGYSGTGGWAVPQVVASASPGESVVFPVVGMDDRGITHAAWGSGPSSGSVRNVTYRALNPTSGWSAPWTRSMVPYYLAAMAAAPDGNVSFVWVETIQGGHALQVARYVPNSGWRPVERVDIPYSATHDATSAVGATSNRGNFTAFWLNTDSGLRSLVFREFVAGNDPPALTVVSPQQGAQQASPTVVVSGVTSPNASVAINGASATVAADGSYSLRVALEAGTNAITVTATDPWHNTATASLSVTFNDPVPALEAQVMAAQSNATAAKDQSAALQNQLSLTSSALNDSRALAQRQQTDIDALKNRTTSTPAASDPTAIVAGLLGAALGAAGVGLSLRRPRGGSPSAAPTLKGAPSVENPAAASGGEDTKSEGKSQDRTPEALEGKGR